MSKFVSIITVTYRNSSEAIASQALAENMMEKIALDNGCDRVRCFLSGDITRVVIFEYNEEIIQKKVIEALKKYTEIHKNAFTHKMVSVRGKLLSDSYLKS
tara:strand:- start:603 stop:905 length:303 start_codon:yes stop_codon:yes gene_type:complete